jgi:3',5'-cyclic AMP phosphodiesterase CpdA
LETVDENESASSLPVSDGDDHFLIHTNLIHPTFFDDDEELVETAASFVVGKENVPPQIMPKAPKEPGPHFLKNGTHIEQTNVDDFFTVTMYDRRFRTDGDRVAMLETSFYDDLIGNGRNKRTKSRFFRDGLHEEKRRKPRLHATGTY